MRAVYKLPGRPAEIIEAENELHALQKMVGGDIEVTHERAIGKGGRVDFLLICNEEGMYLDMAENVKTPWGMAYRGPVLAVAEAGEEFAGLGPDEARLIARQLDARSV